MKRKLNHIVILLMALLIVIGMGATPRSTGQAGQGEGRSPGALLTVLDESAEGLVLELTLPEPQVETRVFAGENCQVLNVPGLAQVERPGEPQLLERVALVGLPPTGTPSLEIVMQEEQIMPGQFDLCPGESLQVNREIGGFHQQVASSRERGPAYGVDELRPETAADLLGTGWLRSQRYAQVRLNAVRYNPVSGQVRYASRLVVKVEFNGTGGGAIINEFEFEDSLRGMLVNYEQARAWRSRPAPVEPAAALELSPQPAYRVGVKADGIYRVSYADLLAAGVGAAELEALDPATLQLFNMDSEAAILLEVGADGSFDPGEALLFYGLKARGKYTDENIYWLRWGVQAGRRMAALDGTPGGSAVVPLDFQTTKRIAVDTDYFGEKGSGVENDHWYWTMVAAISGPASVDFKTTLTNISTQSRTARVRVLLQGYTATPYHHTRVYLNGQQIDDHYFVSGTEYQFEVSVPQSLLLEGENTFKVECPRDGNITQDVVWVNWFEIDYYDTYTAEGDRLRFDLDSAGTWQAQVSSFSLETIEAYDVTDPLNPALISGGQVLPGASGYDLVFEASVTGERRYLAQTAAQRLSPARIELDAPSSWKTPANAADHIVISHGDFITQAQALADFRAGQGLRTAVVDVQDVYDEFNGGVFSPEAIKSFLAYAYASWAAPAPRYVLLLGDGHYDFKNVYGFGEINYIPPYLADVDPWIGETAAENRYVSVSGGDILPDLHIGRLPARSAAEAQVMVDKIIRYEQDPLAGDWLMKMTFTSDNADSAGDFAAESDAIIAAYVPDVYLAERIYYLVNYTTASTAKAALLAAVNDGRLIVHYTGHASVSQWAGENLLKFTDLPTLTNGDKLPFFAPMTCAEGYFIFPSAFNNPAMAEAALRISGKGSVASWSATGYGLTDGHRLLDESLFDQLFKRFQAQLGPLTTTAKVELFARTGDYNDLIETYTLFGDPATRLNMPYAPHDIQLTPNTVAENAPSGTPVGQLTSSDRDPGDSFTYSLATGEGDSGNMYFTLSGSQLLTGAVFDYEVQPSYTIRVRSTDSFGFWFEKILSVQVTNVYEPPTEILLNHASVQENQPASTWVGTFSTTDPDAGDTFTYSLVTGEGDSGNGSFSISGSSLVTSAVFNFEAQTSYSIRVRSTDLGGNSIEESFIITITNANEEPYDIALSNSVIAESAPVGSLVGLLSSLDPDAGDAFTYSLVDGEGAEGNLAFTISENQLLTNAALDYGTQPSYSIRVRSTDAGGLPVEEVFTITLVEVGYQTYLPVVLSTP